MVAKKETSAMLRLTEAVLAELAKDPETVWTPTLAATFLGVTHNTLRDWRRKGGGPKYVRIGPTKVGYMKRDLLEWARGRVAQSTTEEALASSPGGST